jgi:hypothetical protein
MRDTLITGLLTCLPAATLLASAALALLVNKLRQAVDRPFHHPGTTQAEMGRPLAAARNRQEMCYDAPPSSVPTGRLRVLVQVRDGPSLPRKNVSARR